MIARVTPTLVICAVGAAVTGGLLGLPPAASEVSTSPPGSVRIAGFEFGAARAARSATVSVVNADAVAHTLSGSDGAFGTGVLDAGATGSFVVPSEPGTYEIVCQIHPTMTGTLVVD